MLCLYCNTDIPHLSFICIFTTSTWAVWKLILSPPKTAKLRKLLGAFDTWPTLCPGPTGDSQHHLQVLKFKKTSKCWIILVNITLKTWNKYLIQQNNVKKWKFINKTTECVSQTVWSFRGLLIIKLRVHFHPICYIGVHYLPVYWHK